MRSKRKDEHVQEALKQSINTNDFDRLRFVHQSFPNLNYEDVDTSVTVFGRQFPLPVYINAMTGGSKKTEEINRKLALLAKKYDLMMVVGSQHAAIDDPSLKSSYQIARKTHPQGFIVGNVNPNASVEAALCAIEMLEADALSIHVNPAQELTMDEGDRDFKHWLDNIELINKSVKVPVIVKEVGFGISHETINTLKNIGIKNIDVSGKGGTNFIAIENNRSINKRFDYLHNWGLSTVECLIMARNQNDITKFASGGIRNPLDVIKALALGAEAVGLSRYFLDLAQLEEEKMYESFSLFVEDIKRIMLLLGAKNIKELRQKDIIMDIELSRLYEKKY